MKTDNLIDALVADRPPRGRPLRWALVAALLAGGLVSLVLFFATLGVRADIGPALATWRFELKVGLVLLALGLAFSLCIALSRPVAPRIRAGACCRLPRSPSSRLRSSFSSCPALHGRAGWWAATPWSA